MASSCYSTNILLFKTDLGGQLVMHKLHATTNTQKQHLYF